LIRAVSDHVVVSVVDIVTSWNLLVSFGTGLTIDSNLTMLGTAILLHDTIHLFMERWRSVLHSTVEFDINSEAHQSGSHSLVEESDEQLSSDQGIENNENHWNPNRGELIGILSSISEDQIA